MQCFEFTRLFPKLSKLNQNMKVLQWEQDEVFTRCVNLAGSKTILRMGQGRGRIRLYQLRKRLILSYPKLFCLLPLSSSLPFWLLIFISFIFLILLFCTTKLRNPTCEGFKKIFMQKFFQFEKIDLPYNLISLEQQ